MIELRIEYPPLTLKLIVPIGNNKRPENYKEKGFVSNVLNIKPVEKICLDEKLKH